MALGSPAKVDLSICALQVVEELAASIAVDIMVGILDVKTSVDTTFGIYGAQVEQQATGSES